ncbi:hypothetical protein GF362_04890 [Candidatus Dojkabacteria bacterium]|nr:hypothetical protein [Candidatus Dojkabacteria bacterium]
MKTIKEFLKNVTASKLLILILLSVILICCLRIGFLTSKVLFYSKFEQSKKILDRKGRVLYEKQIPEKGYADYVELQDINPEIIDTFIYVEDRSFWWNPGIDFPRTVKCFAKLFKKNEQVCGASTIPQQYVKIVLGRQDRNVIHKTEEIIVSILLHFFLPKEVILEKYLNSIYFSNLRYGIGSASYGYFGKDNKDLDIAQVSFLVSIPNSPKKLDPYTNKGEVKNRQMLVLNILQKHNKISNEEKQAYFAESLSLRNKYKSIKAPHFVLGLETDQFDEDILTTLDLDLYEQSLAIINKHITELYKYNATNAAIVVLDAESGEILTLVGSRDFFATDIDGQVNSAFALRNPGSTLKPFTYSAAFSENITPATMILDKEQVVYDSLGRPYFPRNYDLQEHGWVSVRESLANSYNIPAVLTLKTIGVNNLYILADQIGLEEIRQQDADIAATLGGCSVSLYDLTNAYRIFPNEGLYKGPPVNMITKDKKEDIPQEVFSKNGREITYLVSSILSDNDSRRYSFGSLSKLNLPFKAYAKTGTAQNFTDSWTIGYTKNYVIGVWVGNNDNSGMEGINGIRGAGKIWHDEMLLVQEYYEENFSDKINKIEQPTGIESIEICKETGEIFDEKCNSYPYTELFIQDKGPASQETIKRINVISPEGITIIDPYDKDTIFYQQDLLFPIRFKANQEFDQYILNVNGRDVNKSLEGEYINWELEPGEFEIKIVGKIGNQRVESNSIMIYVEQ